MNYIDFLIIAIVLISALISIMRGFVKESISTATWIFAVWVSTAFAPKLAILMPDNIEMVSLRIALSMAILFIITLLVGGLANFLISTLVTHSGLSGTDRALGTVFGVIRGIVIVAALILLGGLLQMDQANWWQESFLLDYFQIVAIWIKAILPDGAAQYFGSF